MGKAGFWFGLQVKDNYNCEWPHGHNRPQVLLFKLLSSDKNKEEPKFCMFIKWCHKWMLYSDGEKKIEGENRAFPWYMILNAEPNEPGLKPSAHVHITSNGLNSAKCH